MQATNCEWAEQPAQRGSPDQNHGFTGKLRPDPLQLTPEMLPKDRTKSWESPGPALKD